MESLIDLHHDLMFFLIIILIFVLYFFIEILTNFLNIFLKKWCLYSIKIKTKLKIFQIFLEIFWILIPAIILINVLLPSFSLLYAMDELLFPEITIKIIGHQWYWTYEYSDYIYKNWNKKNINLIFDSYMILENDLTLGQFRLLEVDNRICLPININIRCLITSSDVLHSWAIPALGVKLDACPGRLNQIFFNIKRKGVFYGQCSEICGANHGFMPIVLNAINLKTYLNFLEYYKIF